MSTRLHQLISLAQMMTNDHAQTDAPPEFFFTNKRETAKITVNIKRAWQSER